MKAIKQKGRLKAALIKKGTVLVATFILHGNLQKIISIYIWNLDLFEITPAFAGNGEDRKEICPSKCKQSEFLYEQSLIKRDQCELQVVNGSLIKSDEI